MNLKSLFSFLLVCLSLISYSQNSDNVPRPVVIDYIDTYKAIAISEMKRTGVPASITLAQGIHETEAGTSELVRKSNNHFGIKCKEYWAGDKVYHDDDAKGECFRSYTRAFDSYMDHSDFLKNSARYGFLFQLDPTDFEGWANGLRKAGYATNPKYASILIKIINNYHLQDYTLIAMGKMKPEEEWLASVKSDNSPIITIPAPLETPVVKIPEPVNNYPEGEFKINDTRVVYAKAGTSLLSIADKYDVAFKRLIDFNELKKEDDNSLPSGQLIFLQRKRKTGANEFHLVTEGESLYDICQVEAIRLESLLEYNHLANGMQPAIGERLYLKASAPARPILISATRVMPATSMPGSATAMQADPFFTHVVQTKETLYAISKKYNVPVDKLKEWNKLANYDLKKGQELIIYKN